MRPFFLLIAIYALSAMAEESAPPLSAEAATPPPSVEAEIPPPAAEAVAPPAAEAEAQPVPEKPLPLLETVKAGEQLSTKQDNVFEEVDIFGDALLFSPAIWSDMLKLQEADHVVQETIEEKKFANDDYFMRNIDREEFEEERLFLLLDDRIRLYDKYIAEMRKQLAGDSAAAALQAMEPQP